MIGGLEVKAGPEANSSLVLTLKSNGARFFSIEPTSLRDALGSCLIRRSCVARVKSGSDRLVKQLLVAKDLSLMVQEKGGGGSFPLDFAVGKKLVEVKLGTGREQTQTTDLPSRGDMAFGARLFDPQEFADVQPCGQDLVPIKASGTTTSTVLVQSRDNKADERRAAVTDKDELAQVSLATSSLQRDYLARGERSEIKFLVVFPAPPDRIKVGLLPILALHRKGLEIIRIIRIIRMPFLHGKINPADHFG